MPLFEPVLSLFIAILTVPGFWLQLNRLRKKGTSEGLSVTYIALGSAAGATWLVYGIVAHEALQVVCNASATLALLLILVAMVRFDPRLRPVCFFIGAYLIAITAAGFLFGPDLPGMLGTSLGFVCRIPQVYKSWREPGGVAVSVPNFLLIIVGALGWLVFGWIHQDVFVLVSSGFSIVTAGYIVARTLRADDDDVAVAVAA